MHDVAAIERSLAEIAALLALSGESPFKAQAYERGAELVRTLGDKVGALAESERLTEVEGIGARLAAQIVELWRTGRSSYLEQLRGQHPPGALELSRLPGMTARRRVAIQSALGVTSIESLKEACLAQRVRALPGFGVKTEQKLLEAIAQHEQQQAVGEAASRSLLLVDALALAGRMERELRDVPGVEAALPSGALRRGEELVEQLDLVVVGEERAVEGWLAQSAQVGRVAGMPFRALLPEGVALDLHLTSAERAGARLLLATGAAPHVEALRTRALELGLRLTPDGLLSESGALVAGASEEAIYAALGLPYTPPELRHADGAGVEVPSDLIELGQVRGLVHCHTTYSDGKHTIEEMARAAEALGMEYITITDHSPSAHYAGGLGVDRLQQQWDEIATVQERVGIRILRGTESDILADGALDYPDHILEQFDVVIASIHGRHRMNRSEMTSRLVRALSLPVFKIWGHALGRLLLSREPFECDLPTVLDALAGSRGAVEVNGDPRRLDLAPAHIPLVRARAIPLVLSVDAHSTRGLEVLPLAVTMARRGGVRRDEVLNTLPVEAFCARVRPTPA